MLGLILAILIILWLVGVLPVTGVHIPDVTLFVINNHPITLWNLLVLAVICWAIGILPSPFRQIASVMLILWILSIIGILAIYGLSNILLLGIIIGLIVYLVQGRSV